MAKQTNMPLTRKHIDTLFADEFGDEFLKLSYEEREEMIDGVMIEVKRGGNILLSNGRFWNPSLSKGNTPSFVGRCKDCLKQRLFGRCPTGLVDRDEAKLCHNCGTLCCPKHRKKKDGHWRCKHCHRKHRIKSSLLNIFFEWR